MKPRELARRVLTGPAWYLSDLLSQRKQFMFLHIPKTAGTSLIHAIRRAGLQRRIIRAGHWARVTDLHPRGRNWRSFTVIRNPLAWYVSLYKSRFQNAPDHPDKDYHRMPDNSWEDFFRDFVLFENGIQGFARWRQGKQREIEELAGHQAGGVGALTIRYLYHCVPDWRDVLARDDAIQYALDNHDRLNRVDHLLRTEHLQADFDRMIKAENESLALDLSIRAKVSDENPNISADKRKHFSAYYTPEMEAEVRQRDRLLFMLFDY